LFYFFILFFIFQALLENMRDACCVWKLRHLIVASCIWNFVFSSPLSQLV
jgi:hypothetical protein